MKLLRLGIVVALAAAACMSQVVDERWTARGGSAGKATSASAASGAGGGSCGDGKLDPGEECDLGKANSCVDGTSSACSCLCKKSKCGDGVIQAGECCDDADGGGNAQASNCTANCQACKSSTKCMCGQPLDTTAATGPCNPTIFKAVVSNQQDPSMPAAGVPALWSYKGLVGFQAGKALCQAVGADHVCRYDEVVKADANGELAAIPTDLTYWLYRTTNVPDYQLSNGTKSCNASSDCGGNDVCDPITNVCSWKPGAGGRCNDWTTVSDDYSEGEWFRVVPDPGGGGVTKGSLSFHFSHYTTFDDTIKPPCSNETILGCAGPCGTPQRAILCCNPKCP